MDLSGQQRKQLQEVLVNAFPSKASLEQMLSFNLEKNLDVIAEGKDLQQIVFNLIKKAEAEGWVKDLIVGARNENSRNLHLQNIAKELLSNECINFEITPNTFTFLNERKEAFREVVLNIVKKELRDSVKNNLINDLEQFYQQFEQRIGRLVEQQIDEHKIQHKLETGELSKPTIDEELRRVKESAKAHLKLAIYLKSDKRRHYLSNAIANDCYEKIVELYDDEDVDEAIDSFSCNLSYCLDWLYDSIKAFSDLSIESKTKEDLRSFDKELFEYAFKILEEKIKKQSNFLEEAKEASDYLKILLKHIWS